MGLCGSKNIASSTVAAASYIEPTEDGRIIITILSPDQKTVDYSQKQKDFFRKNGLKQIPVNGQAVQTYRNGVTETTLEIHGNSQLYYTQDNLQMRA